MRVQLRLGYLWTENSRYLGPSEYLDTLAAGVRSLLSNRVEMDVHIKTHPRFMDEWVDILVRTVVRVNSLHFVFVLTLVRGASPLTLVILLISSLCASFIFSDIWFATSLNSAPVVGETPGTYDNRDRGVWFAVLHTASVLIPSANFERFDKLFFR